ncbi:MAG TPA: hypothetical protein PK668_06825 [Myxococcota bacterium]|nr:hypothetical protein [Myxococcota bacterium]HRY92443.1 hypothetical protein [Myxococcota bacterium]
MCLPACLGLLLCLGPACSEETRYRPDAGQEEDAGQDGFEAEDFSGDGEAGSDEEGDEGSADEADSGCGTAPVPAAVPMPGPFVRPAPSVTCPDISGSYRRIEYCLSEPNYEPSVFVQDGCAFTFIIDALYCSGTIDSAMNLDVECGGLGWPGQGTASLVEDFWIVFSPQCSYGFVPTWERTPCAFQADPTCAALGQVCGVVAEEGTLVPRCVQPLPDGLPPGMACDDVQGARCENSLCMNGRCAALCQDDTQCSSLPFSTCQQVPYTLGGITMGIPACSLQPPGEPRCHRTADCPLGTTCRPRPASGGVLTTCQAPAVLDPSFEQVCLTELDCPQGMTCGLAEVPDLAGTLYPIQSCVRQPDACSSTQDCEEDLTCLPFVEGEPPRFATRCTCHLPAGEADTGEDCQQDSDCASAWCGQDRRCVGLCHTDEDCPSIIAGGLQFRCSSTFFSLGGAAPGPLAVDDLGVCRPILLPCLSLADCSARQVCKPDLSYRRPGPHAGCDRGGPGTAQLGEACPGGSADCWSGLCLLPEGGSPAEAYCSTPCEVYWDCNDSFGDARTCKSIPIEVYPGLVVTMRTCVRLPYEGP